MFVILLEIPFVFVGIVRKCNRKTIKYIKVTTEIKQYGARAHITNNMKLLKKNVCCKTYYYEQQQKQNKTNTKNIRKKATKMLLSQQ